MKKAFTLIELLVVIAIIGILAVIVTVNLSSAKQKANDAKAKTDISALMTAIEMYKDTIGAPPAAANYEELTLSTDYISKKPTVPSAEYTYTFSQNGTDYILYTTLKKPKIEGDVFGGKNGETSEGPAPTI